MDLVTSAVVTLVSYLVLVLIVTILTNVTLVTMDVTQMKNALIQLEVTFVSKILKMNLKK